MTQATDSRFIGNGAYCYADGLAMLLAAAGARWDPGTLECLTAVGLGARWWHREEMIYFSLLPPDRGLSLALEALGVAVEEGAAEAPGAPPFAALGDALAAGPLLLGPLDMGNLSYLPNHRQLQGCDHFVLLTGLGESEVRVHDPLGYPNVALPLKDLARAWAAEDIAYARGAYRYWAGPRPGPRPAPAALRTAALAACRQAYDWAGTELPAEKMAHGPTAFEAAAAHLEETGAAALLGQLIDFGLPLGARRAHDLAAFLKPGYGELAALKARQAIAFMDAFSQAVAGERKELGASIRTIGQLDEDFREGLFRA